MKRTLRASYDRSAAGYDESFSALQQLKYQALLGEGAALLRELAAREPGRPLRLLDAGCGTGLLAEHLLAAGPPLPRLVGLDFSMGMLLGAQRRGVLAVQGDLERLPFGAGCCDAVFAFTAVGILPGPLAPALCELARVLRPGGVLVLSLLARSCPAGLERELAAAGLRAGARRACGQDVGLVAIRGGG